MRNILGREPGAQSLRFLRFQPGIKRGILRLRNQPDKQPERNRNQRRTSGQQCTLAEVRPRSSAPACSSAWPIDFGASTPVS